MGKPSKQQWKLKDLLDDEIVINEWSLDTPPIQYVATSASYGRQAGGAMIHFAQVLPSGQPMNALAVAIPPTNISELFLPNLGQVRERLERLREDGRIEEVSSVDLEKFVDLKPENYVQKAAERVRVATNDDYSTLDFYKMPVVPRALIEQQPNMSLGIDGVVRVIMSTSIFSYLVRQMEEIEAYRPEGDDSASDS